MASLPPSLDHLPPEITHQILARLEDADLRALGLASKCWCSLARPHWGWTIQIRLSTPQQLCEDLATWSHRVAVIGPERVSQLIISGGTRNPLADDRKNVALEALSEFVHKLLWLSQLKVDCEDWFGDSVLPRCLWKALENLPPQCKLDYRRFSPQRVRSTSRISREDYAFLTSPNLHAVEARYCHFTGTEHGEMELNYAAEALLDMTRFNRNIKSVSMYPLGIFQEIDQVRGLLQSWPPWPGFIFPEGISPPVPAQRGAPTSLHCRGDAENFCVYSQLIDFSQLQKLNLTSGPADWLICHALKLGPEERPGRERAPTCTCTRNLRPYLNFSSLKELVLEITVTNHGARRDLLTSSEPYEAFLRHIPPLAKLSIHGFSTLSLFNTIVSHHGGSLRQLSIVPEEWQANVILSLPEVVQFQSMPFLTHLTIPVRRSKGSAAEVAIYHALGQLPKVQEMSLFLCYPLVDLIPYDPARGEWDEAPNDPSFDEFEQQFWYPEHDTARMGHFKDLLISGALDEKLATSIFNRISSAKTARSFPLERLKLFSMGGGDEWDQNSVDDMSLDYVFQVVSKWWNIERGRRDDQRDVLFTRLIREDEFFRRFRPREPQVQLDYTTKKEVLGPSTEKLFSHVWPDWQTRNEDWRHAWHSFPLDDGGSLEDPQAG
ncbi:hypothetical protein A1O3_02447 [Capronia epimyces CBS 606.96]|uniref:F-box domain-containing protein n=1 Tax=Capronia epimyces CBS 606.96 TaxID=1182542 RepID=W9YIB4_9EURO|nr:uncharacterized protein A1O3_02447 [Capronia epimyces CBS 606.96]EXJ89380.1 hypothetical protein A1O3_02447 [Capronia epimyces CBS 606.96]